ncbi:MAG: TATA box-binding protein [Promethearchaeota archaeon]
MMELNTTEEDHSKNLTYTIQNIVVKTSLNLRENLNLNRISKEIRNTEYNKERFPGLFLRLRYPKCAIILFKNGKLILTGIKSFDHIALAINRLILKFNEIYENTISRDSIHPYIVNIVITANFYKKINLDLAVIRLDNAIYEPEVFPGLIYHSSNPVKAAFLIFSTGQIVFTGVKEKRVIEPALINLRRLLYKKNLFITS